MRKCFHEKKVPLRSRTKISVVTLASSQAIKLKFKGMRVYENSREFMSMLYWLKFQF